MPRNGFSAQVGMASGQTATERLNAIQGLLDKGLVTQEEYDKKRADILAEL